MWNLLFSLFGVAWILSCLVKETLLGWHGAFVGKTHKKAWQMALLYIFWSVWKERNLLAFGNEELSLHRLKYYFLCNLWSWVRVSIVLSPLSLVSYRNVLFNINHLDRFGGFKIVGLRRLGDIPSSRVND